MLSSRRSHLAPLGRDLYQLPLFAKAFLKNLTRNKLPLARYLKLVLVWLYGQLAERAQIHQALWSPFGLTGS
jgi:hypothetical protein